jgi:hypothetical protein
MKADGAQQLAVGPVVIDIGAVFVADPEAAVGEMDDAFVVEGDAAIGDRQIGETIGGLAHIGRIESRGGRPVSLMQQDRILIREAQTRLLLRTLRPVVGCELDVEDLQAPLEIQRAFRVPAAIRQHVERAGIAVAVALPGGEVGGHAGAHAAQGIALLVLGIGGQPAHRHQPLVDEALPVEADRLRSGG